MSKRSSSRRSFLLAGMAGIGGAGAFQWLRTRPDDDGVPWPLRRVLEINEQVWRERFSERLAPAFSVDRARMPRENGREGLRQEFDADSWRLMVLDAAGETAAIEFTLDDIKSFPRVEMVTELCCIEGWSQVVQWAGARFSSLAERSGFHSRYVHLETPDRQYYVGLDIASAVHPQTLLCYEMCGRPLAPEHGAPLRLVTPIKYGIKNIKRIGTIRFTNTRPADYWAERGYDWYAGL
jgi:DMSO/TMAO reductase YedYZ molybdopterin-dependent catalytic subunit